MEMRQARRYTETGGNVLQYDQYHYQKKGSLAWGGGPAWPHGHFTTQLLQVLAC